MGQLTIIVFSEFYVMMEAPEYYFFFFFLRAVVGRGRLMSNLVESQGNTSLGAGCVCGEKEASLQAVQNRRVRGILTYLFIRTIRFMQNPAVSTSMQIVEQVSLHTSGCRATP